MENIENNRSKKITIVSLIFVAITLIFTVIQFVQICRITNEITELKERQMKLEQVIAKLYSPDK